MEITGREIAKRIDIARESQGLSKKDVALYIGASQQVLTDWLNKSTMPSADKIYKISKLLNVSVEWLITGEDSDGIPPEIKQVAYDICALDDRDRELVLNMIAQMKRAYGLDEGIRPGVAG